MSRVLLLRRLAAVVIAAGAIGSCTYVTNSATPEQLALERYIERSHGTKLDLAGINRIAVREKGSGYAGGGWWNEVTVKYRDGASTEKASGPAPDRPGGYVADSDVTIVNCRSRFSAFICLIRGRGFSVQANVDPVKIKAARGEAWMDDIVESAITARHTQRQAKAEWRKIGTD